MAAAGDDERFMAEAVRLSLTHLGLTATNPSVGCLIVRDGEVVGRAVTAVGGRPHAETQALAEAGDKARGATAYVTLEPCSHHGRTPPCAEALIAAGIARVVAALPDPDARVSGRGFRMLADAGVVVETGIGEGEAKRALAGYLIRQTKNRPQVILKLALSSDGKIGRKGAGQVAITGPEARREVHHLRAECDAILVGIGTAIADDPELTVRIAGLEDRSPVRIVLDRELQLPLSSKLAQTAREVPVVVVTREHSKSGSESCAALEAAGVEVLEADDVDSLLFALASRGMSNLLVEGGARVARDFLDAGVVDRILLFTGGAEIGPDGIDSPLTAADIPPGFERVREADFGPDHLAEYERTL